MAADISGYVDLALNTVGFFTIPESITPPPVNKYEYESTSQIGVNQAQIDNVASIMKSWIKADDGKRTALQTKKLRVVIVSSLGVVGSALLYVQGLAPFVGVAGMVASIVIGIGVFSYYASFYDLDSAKARENLSKKIHVWDFKKITDTFTTEQLIRYDLLGSQLSSFTEKQKAGVYANIRNLYFHKQLLDNTEKQVLSSLAKTYNTGTKALKEWIDACRIRSAHIEWNKLNRVPAAGNAQAIEAANNLITITLENKYNQILAPWKVWKDRENANIREAYDNAMSNLNIDYVKCLQGAGTVNASGEFDAARAPYGQLLSAVHLKQRLPS